MSRWFAPGGMTQTLLHGDCLELLPNLPDGSVDLVCADLPYAHMSNGKVRKCTANAWDTPIDISALWIELLRVGKRNAAFVFMATFKFACKLDAYAEQLGLSGYDLIWQKNLASNFMQAKRRPLSMHELILTFYREQTTYNPQMEARQHGRKGKNNQKGYIGTSYGAGARNAEYDFSQPVNPGSVRMHALPARCDSLHPTQKPVALLEWLVKTYTNPGDTVLDPTMGSGTTGVACVNTQRNFVGIEKDAMYFKTAQSRIEGLP